MINTHYTVGPLARALMPDQIRNALTPLWKQYQCWRVCSDVRSAKALWSAYTREVQDCKEYDVIRVQQLNNETFTLRSNRTDSGTILSAFFYKFHLPAPRLLPEPVHRIIDLGGNIGATAAHLCVRYPAARMLAVELDEENAAICTENTRTWRDRISVIQAGVHFEDSSLCYRKQGVARDGFRLAPEENSSESVSVRAISLNSLFEQCLAKGEPVDYLKMDIEGSERGVLTKNVDWARRVRCMKVELHGDYTVSAARKDITNLGFKVHVDTAHFACITAVR